MELSRFERAILANQLRILAKLDPGEADGLIHQCSALEWGFELEFEQAVQDIDANVLSADECKEVLDILDMFCAIGGARKRLGKIPNVEDWQVTFVGFDGNNETKQLAYVKWLWEGPAPRYVELQSDMDSHRAVLVLDGYRRQLAAWRGSDDKYGLSVEDITRIASAAHPSRR